MSAPGSDGGQSPLSAHSPSVSIVRPSAPTNTGPIRTATKSSSSAPKAEGSYIRIVALLVTAATALSLYDLYLLLSHTAP